MNDLAGTILQRIRDHGPWANDTVSLDHFCHWCSVSSVDVNSDGHKAGCLWPDIEKATDRPGDDLCHPGGGT